MRIYEGEEKIAQQRSLNCADVDDNHVASNLLPSLPMNGPTEGNYVSGVSFQGGERETGERGRDERRGRRKKSHRRRGKESDGEGRE